MDWVEDKTNPTASLQIVNVTANMYLDVKVNIMGFPMWGSNIHTRDLNITLDVEFDKKHDVYPQFHIQPKLEAAEVKYGFFIFGWILRWILP